MQAIPEKSWISWDIVSEDAIETDTEKVEAVAAWPAPECVRDLRSLIGLRSYYRRFVKGFAEIAAPLHALTGKYAQFEWSEECQTAFEKLNGALTTSPVLAIPSDIGRYILYTDVNESSIGAVLSQRQHGEERAIAYADRMYNKAERNYCTTRKELFAVVYFLRQFKQYLLDARFLVRTDHAVLTCLQRASELMGQQERWQERLQEYMFDIEHRPGHKHGNAEIFHVDRVGGLNVVFQNETVF